jgi:hypothetical protein
MAFNMTRLNICFTLVYRAFEWPEKQNPNYPIIFTIPRVLLDLFSGNRNVIAAFKKLAWSNLM